MGTLTVFSTIKSRQVGMGKSEVVVPITLLLVKELVVKGSFRYGVSSLLVEFVSLSTIRSPEITLWRLRSLLRVELI